MDIWPFRRKQTIEGSGILRGFTDWHSHILPSVDDGVQTMDEALEILAQYERLGIRAVWLTPHVMEDTPNTTERLKGRFEELQTAYKGAIRLHLAAEYMLDNLFKERLDNNDLLTLGYQGDMLLVETSYFNPPANLHGMLEDIKRKGYYPVLAHPERYAYMEKEDYRDLKDKGIMFQLNLLSLIGLYGNEAQRKVEWLLKKGMCDLVGTDTHLKTEHKVDLSTREMKRIKTICEKPTFPPSLIVTTHTTKV